MLTLLTALALAQAPPPIIGGQQAQDGAWPDSVVLLANGRYSFCTGTLIAPDVVLTAGHCMDSDAGRARTSVRIGSVDKQSGGELITVSEKHRYPGYYTGSRVPDLAVLKLSREATLAEPRPIMGDCITEEYGNQAMVTMVGWGLAYPNAQYSPRYQQQVELPITDPECNSRGCEPSQRPGGQFYIYNNGKSAAPGDSGGPVYLMSERGPHLVGVMSLAAQGYSTISVRADKHIEWIERMAGRELPAPLCGNKPVPEADELVTKGRKWGTTMVLAMDEDADDSHSFEIVEDPEFGEATIDAQGELSYRAGKKFSGEDSVTVRVTDDSEYAHEGEVQVKVSVEQGGVCSTVPMGTGVGLGAFALLIGLIRRRRQ